MATATDDLMEHISSHNRNLSQWRIAVSKSMGTGEDFTHLVMTDHPGSVAMPVAEFLGSKTGRRHGNFLHAALYLGSWHHCVAYGSSPELFSRMGQAVDSVNDATARMRNRLPKKDAAYLYETIDLVSEAVCATGSCGSSVRQDAMEMVDELCGIIGGVISSSAGWSLLSFDERLERRFEGAAIAENAGRAHYLGCLVCTSGIVTPFGHRFIWKSDFLDDTLTIPNDWVYYSYYVREALGSIGTDGVALDLDLSQTASELVHRSTAAKITAADIIFGPRCCVLTTSSVADILGGDGCGDDFIIADLESDMSGRVGLDFLGADYSLF